MSRKQVVMVVSFDDKELDNETETFNAGDDVARTVMGCIEDMEPTSFPNLEIQTFSSPDALANHFNYETEIEPNFLPVNEAALPKP